MHMLVHNAEAAFGTYSICSDATSTHTADSCPPRCCVTCVSAPPDRGHSGHSIKNGHLIASKLFFDGQNHALHRQGFQGSTIMYALSPTILRGDLFGRLIWDRDRHFHFPQVETFAAKSYTNEWEECDDLVVICYLHHTLPLRCASSHI